MTGMRDPRRAGSGGRRLPASRLRSWAGARKTEALKSTEWLEEVRGLWAERANEALARAGEEARIDHRSHAERGLEILPTVHEGPTARAMAERDKIVERVQLNRDVKAANAELLQLEKERGQVAQAIERLLAKARETIEKLSQRAQSVFGGGPAPVFARVRRAAPGPEEHEAAERVERIRLIDRLATRAQGAAWIDGQVAEREREIELAVRRSAQYQSGRALFESETSIDDGNSGFPTGELLARFGGQRQSSRNEAARAEKKIADHPETQSRLHRFLREPDPVLKQWRVDADRARGYEREYAQKYDRIEAQWTGREEEWNAAAVARRDAGEKQIEKWQREIDDLKTRTARKSGYCASWSGETLICPEYCGGARRCCACSRSRKRAAGRGNEKGKTSRWNGDEAGSATAAPCGPGTRSATFLSTCLRGVRNTYGRCPCYFFFFFDVTRQNTGWRRAGYAEEKELKSVWQRERAHSAARCNNSPRRQPSGGLVSQPHAHAKHGAFRWPRRCCPRKPQTQASRPEGRLARATNRHFQS